MDRQPLRQNVIEQILEPYPSGLKLLDEMSGFYSPAYLNFRQIDDANGPVGEASFLFDEAGSDNWHFIRVAVDIKPSHPRAPLSLVHELLHLRLRTEIFPIFNSNYSPSPLEDDFSLFGGVVNAVDHHVFKVQWISMGLPLKEIVPDPESSRSRKLDRWQRELGYDDVQDAQRAEYLYFLAWMTDQLLETNREVPATLKVLCPIFPDMEAKMNWLSQWFIRREFDDSLRYKPALDEACENLNVQPWPLYTLSRVNNALEAASA